MKAKNQIIALIQHDLKNHQSTAYQKAQNWIGNSSDPDLLDIVFNLMKVPASAEIDWGKTYCNYMNFAPCYSIQSTSKQLRSQAEICFTHLQCIIDLEIENGDSLRGVI